MAIRVRWFGQACFSLTDGNGKRLVIDPFDHTFCDYPLPQGLTADAVLVTHEHADHNNVGLVAGTPRVLRAAQGVGDHDLGFCQVRGIPAFHDEARGKQRGSNTVYRIEMGGLAFVHLGDLGHLLSAGQATALQPVDVLFAPLGGHFTLDAAKLDALVESLAPRVVVGMHFATRYTPKLPIASAAEVARGRADVRLLDAPEFEVDRAGLPAAAELWMPAVP
jgi:L-ascorbate metabolism protein UlaG (beta-lactamase superfamily)